MRVKLLSEGIGDASRPICLRITVTRQLDVTEKVLLKVFERIHYYWNSVEMLKSTGPIPSKFFFFTLETNSSYSRIPFRCHRSQSR
jgi:hypothetical protein